MHVSVVYSAAVLVTGTDVILRSDSCIMESKGSTTGPAVQPCLECRNLHDHKSVMGICHHAIDGAPEKTPYGYLAPSHAINALQRKDDQIAKLQLHGLNSLKSLTMRNHQIEGWKRFALAISKSDIPQLQSLTLAALHDGAGVYGLIERVNQAAQRTYSPQGYKMADFERTFLMWKLGGRSAANIAHCTLGIPSIESARRHIQVAPITASPGLPTAREMASNLALCFETQAGAQIVVGRKIGMTMPIDKIKIQERLWWDSFTNMILGVCREHGHQCSLEFCTIVQADVLWEYLGRKLVHLASKVSLSQHCIMSQC
jgi:hypothetical protein